MQYREMFVKIDYRKFRIYSIIIHRSTACQQELGDHFSAGIMLIIFIGALLANRS